MKWLMGLILFISLDCEAIGITMLMHTSSSSSSIKMVVIGIIGLIISIGYFIIKSTSKSKQKSNNKSNK